MRRAERANGRWARVLGIAIVMIAVAGFCIVFVDHNGGKDPVYDAMCNGFKPGPFIGLMLGFAGALLSLLAWARGTRVLACAASCLSVLLAAYAIWTLSRALGDGVYFGPGCHTDTASQEMTSGD